MHTKASEFPSEMGLLMTNFSHKAFVIQEAMAIFIQNWTLQLTLSFSSKVIPKESNSGHSSVFSFVGVFSEPHCVRSDATGI